MGAEDWVHGIVLVMRLLQGVRGVGQSAVAVTSRRHGSGGIVHLERAHFFVRLALDAPASSGALPSSGNEVQTSAQKKPKAEPQKEEEVESTRASSSMTATASLSEEYEAAMGRQQKEAVAQERPARVAPPQPSAARAAVAAAASSASSSREFKQLEELMGALKLDEKRKLRERLTEMIEVEELRDLISKP